MQTLTQPLTKSEKIHLNLKDIAKIIREQLKKEFPKCIFSIQIQRYSMGQSLHINLMQAPFEVFDCVRTIDKHGNIVNRGSAQLNHYTIMHDYDVEDGYSNGAYLTREAWVVLQRAVKLSNEYNFDESDIQTDYFSVNFYLQLSIGKWNVAFVKKGDPKCSKL